MSVTQGNLTTYLQAELTAQMMISNRMLRVIGRDDPSLRAQMVTVLLKSLSSPVWHLEYPADWWQALRARWFPRWAKRRWPVRMTTHNAARYCPHVGVSDEVVHVAFLDGEEVKV